MQSTRSINLTINNKNILRGIGSLSAIILLGFIGGKCTNDTSSVIKQNESRFNKTLIENNQKCENEIKQVKDENFNRFEIESSRSICKSHIESQTIALIFSCKNKFGFKSNQKNVTSLFQTGYDKAECDKTLKIRNKSDLPICISKMMELQCPTSERYLQSFSEIKECQEQFLR